MSKFVEFKGVSLGYGRHTVLKDLNFSLERGRYIGLVGTNGAGKSTLLKGLTGALRPKTGKISFWNKEGQEISRLEALGYMPQHQSLEVTYPLSVLDVVLMGRYAKMGWRIMTSKEDKEAALNALEQVNLADRANSHISDLSGGQLQRVLLARALAADPEILLLDEPTNGMDLGASQDTLEIAAKLHKQGMTIIIVTHILEIVARNAQQVGIFVPRAEGGCHLHWGTTDEVFTSERLSELYGRPISWPPQAATTLTTPPSN